MLDTRHIWLVDRQPAQARYTGSGNVSRSIEISMEFKSTFTAEELRAIAVPFVDVTTDGTLLRSEPGIHEDNLLSKILCFIPEEFFKLVERPCIQFPVEHRPTPFLHTDLCKILKCKYCKWSSSNLFRDTVINISHKPSFSPGHSTEFPFSGSSAFGLEFSSKMGVFTTGILHSRRIKKRVIGTDCNVNDTPVNAENINFVNWFWGVLFYLAMQIEQIILFSESQCRRLDLPRQVSGIIYRYGERGFDPPVGGSNRGIPGIKTDPDHTGIVPHCRELFTKRFKLTFHRFQRFTRNISRTLHQRGWEIRNRLSDISISGIVAVNLIERMDIEPPFGTDVERHSILSHCLKESIAAIRRNIEFQSESPNHTHILTPLECITFGGDGCRAIHPTTKVMGPLAPRS